MRRIENTQVNEAGPKEQAEVKLYLMNNIEKALRFGTYIPTNASGINLPRPVIIIRGTKVGNTAIFVESKQATIKVRWKDVKKFQWSQANTDLMNPSFGDSIDRNNIRSISCVMLDGSQYYFTFNKR